MSKDNTEGRRKSDPTLFRTSEKDRPCVGLTPTRGVAASICQGCLVRQRKVLNLAFLSNFTWFSCGTDETQKQLKDGQGTCQKGHRGGRQSGAEARAAEQVSSPQNESQN